MQPRGLPLAGLVDRYPEVEVAGWLPIRAEVLPRYANTHTESSGTGLQTSRLREDARQIIHHEVGATADDLVIFCGSEATAAVNKLIGILELPPGRRRLQRCGLPVPHKFPGGPQTPGVLVVRRDLVRNSVPTVPGGGTVAFVDPVGHRYLDDPVAREEGGTPRS